MRTYLTLGTALLLSVAPATMAQAAINLVQNGSFEIGIDPAGQTDLPTGDTTSLPGWTVLPTGITYADNSAWDASDGVRSIELNTGNGTSGVLQRIEGFTPGYRYELTFQISANPFDPDPRPKASRVIATMSGNQGGLYAYTLNNVNTATNMLYDTVTFSYIATTNFANLRIGSATAGEYGPVIDNVSVSVVPEVATWGMLVAGFGLVGFASRRRSRIGVSA